MKFFEIVLKIFWVLLLLCAIGLVIWAIIVVIGSQGLKNMFENLALINWLTQMV